MCIYTSSLGTFQVVSLRRAIIQNQSSPTTQLFLHNLNHITNITTYPYIYIWIDYQSSVLIFYVFLQKCRSIYQDSEPLVSYYISTLPYYDHLSRSNLPPQIRPNRLVYSFDAHKHIHSYAPIIFLSSSTYMNLATYINHARR